MASINSTISSPLAIRWRLVADGPWLIGLVVILAVLAPRYCHFSTPPFEDAAILMRYADHLANGHGIVWNIGEPPVDGGTDFLFLVVLAGLAKAGLTLEAAVRLVGIAAHVATVLILYLAVSRSSSRILAFLAAAYLAAGPGLKYVEAHFGTTFFALGVTVTWCLANQLAENPASHQDAVAFAGVGLLTGLIRPEGVFLAGLMLSAVAYKVGLREARIAIYWFLGIFAFLGGAYFLWRWHYFGYPLPNTYYKKGSGTLHLNGLEQSLRYILSLLAPFLPFLIVGFRRPLLRRQAVFSLIPIIGFGTLWVLLSTEMNYMMRFQYAVLPIGLISWPELANGITEDWNLPRKEALSLRNRRILALVIVFVSATVLISEYKTFAKSRHYSDGKYSAGMILRDYAANNYTIATSEAGLLPFYSGWRAIDTWGLNDQWIAHHNQINGSHLNRYKPHVIMFLAPFSPVSTSVPQGDFADMTLVLKRYAENNGYCLAAAFGVSAESAQYYYVRPDFPDAAEIVKRIRHIDYRWWLTGARCVNLALLRNVPRICPQRGRSSE